jgi:hypothetical protein
VTSRARVVGASALTMVLMLAGCGGGSGGGVVSGPPPVTYPTIAGLTGTTALPGKAVRFDFSRPSGAGVPTIGAEMPNLEISYDASNRTYILRSVETSGGAPIEQRFGPAQQVAGLPNNYDATTTAGGVTKVSRFQVESGVNLSYSGLGHWETGGTSDNNQNFYDFYFSYGIQTKPGDLPKTGTASYSLGLRGEGPAPVIGNGSLSADFGAGTVAISLSPEYFYRPGQGPNVFATLTGNGTINSASPGFGMNIAGNGYTGSVNGLFYGPQASEVGGAFSVLTSGGDVAAAGAFSGRRN